MHLLEKAYAAIAVLAPVLSLLVDLADGKGTIG